EETGDEKSPEPQSWDPLKYLPPPYNPPPPSHNPGNQILPSPAPVTEHQGQQDGAMNAPSPPKTHSASGFAPVPPPSSPPLPPPRRGVTACSRAQHRAPGPHHLPAASARSRPPPPPPNTRGGSGTKILRKQKLRLIKEMPQTLARQNYESQGAFPKDFLLSSFLFFINRIIAMCGDYYIGGRRFASLSDLIGYYSHVSCLLKGEKLFFPVAPPE
ncbi:unnamed protein product, partial [Bubo scandiacus]